MSNPIAEAVSGVVEDLFGAAPEAEPAAPNGQDDPAAPEAQDAGPAVELPTIPTVPEDLIEFLDEPDLDEEPVSVRDEDEFVDPDELARENAKLRKQLAYAEQKKAEAQRAKWTEEAKKFFPFADTDSITATSRRGFLREARSSHEALAKRLQPILADVEATKAKAREQAYAEAKAEAAAAWGKPNVGGGASAPIEAAQAADELTAARNSRNLANVAKALIKGQQI